MSAPLTREQALRELDLPEGMGVIMRTVGQGQRARFFVRDLSLLLEQWAEIQKGLTEKSAPACLFEEPDLVDRTVRDLLTDDIEAVVVDDQKTVERMQALAGQVSRRAKSRIQLYTGSEPIFDCFGVESQIATAFQRQVWLPCGGYIVIDETEALIAVDVNTGRNKGSKDSMDQTILQTNLEAADEICRQLRLRNIGGIIIADFIDMKGRRDQQAVYQRVRERMKRDKARTHVLPISQLGLMEMTRQRHSESVRAAVYDDCPYCKGRGKVKSPLTMSVEIQRKLAEILKRRPRDESDFQLRVVVHPTVLERLRNEDQQLLIDLEKRYFGKLSFRGDPTLHAEQFRIFDAATNTELARSAT